MSEPHGPAPPSAGGDPERADTGGERGLRVVRVHEPDRLVLQFHGELDMDTLPRARRAVGAAEAEAPPTLVLDLARMQFVDSSGVRLVLLAQHTAEDAGRRLAVRLGHGPTRRMFDTLGIAVRLEVLDDVDGPP